MVYLNANEKNSAESSLKDFSPPLEEFFDGGKKDRLAEAPGAREKDALIRP
jgi:hypothetical protein